jgi:hypothetical protein
VYIGQFQPGSTAVAFEAVGVQGFATICQCNLYFIVQNIAPGTFVHLESGIDDHIRMGRM